MSTRVIRISRVVSRQRCRQRRRRRQYLFVSLILHSSGLPILTTYL